MPRSRFCRSDGHAASIARAHHVRTGSQPPSRTSLGINLLKTIRATGVHVYTIDRSPALGSLSPVPPRRLREIAEQVRALGIHTEVFPPRRRNPERTAATSH
jgi:hypothetical protein